MYFIDNKCILLTILTFIMLISAVQQSDSYMYIIHIYMYIHTFFFVIIFYYNFITGY